MRIASRTATVLVLFLAASAAACNFDIGRDGLSVGGARSRASDTWTRTYTLPPAGRLEIINRNGRIEVEPADGPQVEVRVDRTASGASARGARALLEATRMSERVSDDLVRIEAMPPRGSDRDWFGLVGGISAVYTVRVPSGLTLSLETRNGGIRLANVAGAIEATTRNGGIRGEGLSGSLKASVRNGGIRVEMAAVTGDVDLSLRNGGIQLEIPRDTMASLDARAVHGGISVDRDFVVQTTESSRERDRFRPDRRRFAGVLNGGGPRISAAARNGGIRILSGRAQS